MGAQRPEGEVHTWAALVKERRSVLLFHGFLQGQTELRTARATT